MGYMFHRCSQLQGSTEVERDLSTENCIKVTSCSADELKRLYKCSLTGKDCVAKHEYKRKDGRFAVTLKKDDQKRCPLYDLSEGYLARELRAIHESGEALQDIEFEQGIREWRLKNLKSLWDS